MEHPLTPSAGLALLLYLFAGSGALGQSNPRYEPDSTQRISVSTVQAVHEPREGTIGTLSHWLASGEAGRVHRWAHPSFRIRLGRGFSITVPKS
jgi:hypothetical protein